MFKKITITLLAVILVALASKNSYSAIGRWYPYALYPGSVDLFAAVVSKYANKYDVAISLEVYSPADIPGIGEAGYPAPAGWVDFGTSPDPYGEVGENDTLSVCRNPGENGWTAPGQNPPPTDTTYSGVSILYYIPKNGKTIAYVEGLTEQPENIQDFCPNGNWDLDSVPEYVEYAIGKEILILTDTDGTKTCYEASSATLNNCYVDLHDVSWDPETISFTGPEYTCVGTKVETVNKDPFDPSNIVDCPAQIQ